MTKKKEDLGGVWRTVGGRRIFIKDGQDLYEAMNDSGKFTDLKKTNSQKTKTKKENLTSKEKEEFEQYIEANKATEKTKDWHLKKAVNGDEEAYQRAKEIDTLAKLRKANNSDDINSDIDNAKEETFKPRAKGAKTFEEHGVAFKDNATNERFSDYLRDKYGTDDIDMITTGSDLTAEGLKKAFNEQEYKKYVEKTLKNDDYLRENRPNDYFYKQIDDKNKKDDIIDGVKKGKALREKLSKIKDPKLEDGTYNIETGEKVDFGKKGFNVSFEQSTDKYTNLEYYEKVKECRELCDGNVYAGKFGGDPEVSFYTEDIEVAKQIMYKYNQHSIWSNELGDIIRNEKYDERKNKTGYKD